MLKENIPGLKDSKKLSPKTRAALAKLILENSYFGFGIVNNIQIDKINILKASLLAMKRAILNLPIKPALVLVDGIHKPDLNFPMRTIIGGDASEAEISAASIVAKVYRDNLMIQYNSKFPNYDFINNKGYGTAEHLRLLKINGYCEIHRKSFKGVIDK